MHPSVTFGDTSPCRGGFTNGCFPQRLPWKGSCRRMPTEGCRTLRGVSPCQAAMPAIGPDRGRSALRGSHGGPCGHPAKDTGKDARQCTPPSPSVTPPLAGEALWNGCRSEGCPCKGCGVERPPKGSPGRGAVGECRLRGAAPYRVFTLAGWLAFAASAGDDLRLLHRRCAPGSLRNAACGRQCPHRPARRALLRDNGLVLPVPYAGS